MGWESQHAQQTLPSRIKCCNFNSCPFVSSIGQQLNMSPELSYLCFQPSPLSHSCPDVCMRASTDRNSRNKAFCLADIRATQLHSFFLVKLIQSSCFFLSRDRLVLKICEEKDAFYLWQNVSDFKSREGKIKWYTGISPICLNLSVLHQHVLNPRVFLSINDSGWIIHALKDPFCWLYFLFSLLHINTIL